MVKTQEKLFYCSVKHAAKPITLNTQKFTNLLSYT